ncbi:MAG: hypothetical protein QOJ37_2412 [Pseudonocardiales bacterium]|nr:hypothetical protein [Pseudonocardiales bacterium]
MGHPSSRGRPDLNKTATVGCDRRYRLAHLASLTVALAVLLYAGRGLWFFYDEWDFLAYRGVFHPPMGLLTPHNEHWSTLPILAYRLLFTIFGLHTYWPYLILLLAVHLILAHLLWRAMRTTGVHPMLSVGTAAVFALLGSGAQNLLWAFQVGFVGSLCFGWGFVLCCAGRSWSRRRVLAAWALALCALMCSGLGVTTTVMGGVAALLVHGWRRAVLLVSVPAVVFAVWYATVGHGHGVALHLSRVPGYVTTGFGNAMRSFIGLPRLGTGVGVAIGVVALALAVAHVLGLAGTGAQKPRVLDRLREQPVVVASVVGVVVLWVVTAAGRAGLGHEQALSSRYVYNTVAVALPALAVALNTLLTAWPRPQPDPQRPDSQPERRGRVVPILAAVVCLALLAVNVSDLRRERRLQVRVDQAGKEEILAGAYLLAQGRAYLPTAKVAGVYSPELSAKAFAGLVARRNVSIPSAISVSAELTGLANLQNAVDLRPAISTVPLPIGAVRVLAGTLIVAPGRCRDVAASARPVQLTLGPLARPSSLMLQSPTTEHFRVQLVDPSQPGAVGLSSPFPLTAHRRHRFVTIVRGLRVQLIFANLTSRLRYCSMPGF